MSSPPTVAPAGPSENAGNAAGAAPLRRKLSTLSGLLPFLRPYRRRVVIAFVFLCLGSAATLAVPQAIRNIIDHGFVAGGHIQAPFLAMLGLALFSAIAVAGRFYQVTWIGERVTADLRQAIYHRMLEQSPKNFETTRTGEVLSRLTGDTTLVQTIVGSSISMGLRNAFVFVGCMVMLAVTSPRLFAVTVGLLLVVVVPLVWGGRRMRTLSRESQDRIADTSAVAGEVLNAMPTVQAFTQEQWE